MMDSTFPGNHAMWRALSRPAWYTVFYLSIIAWEIVTMILCWWGGVRLAQALHSTAAAFHRAKRVAIAGLGEIKTETPGPYVVGLPILTKPAFRIEYNRRLARPPGGSVTKHCAGTWGA
jgi:hypothetical protein